MSTPDSPKWFRRAAAVLQAIVLYITIALPLLWFVHLERGIFQAAFLMGLLIGDFLLVMLLRKCRLFGILCRTACIAWGALAILVCLFAASRATMGDYRSASVEADYFKNKHVVFLAPHYDDDISIASGVAELYARHGSRVSIVLAIDCDGANTTGRIQEAQAAWQAVGIPKENLYFLGIGNGWESMEFDGETVAHIYHSPDSQTVWTSTYALQAMPQAARQSLPYTRENCIRAIKDVLLELRPDVIYANDYDAHTEHRAVSLFFEEAMLQILKEEEDYRPAVFKGYCYRTAWYAPFDFADGINLRATIQPPQRDTEVEMPQYPWESRIRLPLLTDGLNRFLTKTDVYYQLREYPSQGATSQTGAIANGDRVYWQRQVDSLLYHGQIQVGQEPAPLLNDFKLLDTDNIQSQSAVRGIQNVREPVTITLPEPIQAKVLALYDDPRPENQILLGCFQLDDGSTVEFGPLNNNGSATYIPLPDTSFQTLKLYVTAFQGTPGLTEVEAYASDITAPAQKLQYFMFMDDQDNFVYDYYMADSASFALYTYPSNVALDYGAFQITQTGSDACSYTFDNGILTVRCPKGERCEITVTYEDISCSMVLSNPGKLHAWVVDTVQDIDFAILHSSAPGSINSQRLYYQAFIDKMKTTLFA